MTLTTFIQTRDQPTAHRTNDVVDLLSSSDEEVEKDKQIILEKDKQIIAF